MSVEDTFSKNRAEKFTYTLSSFNNPYPNNMALDVVVIENLRTFDHLAVIRILLSKCFEIMILYATFLIE